MLHTAEESVQSSGGVLDAARASNLFPGKSCHVCCQTDGADGHEKDAGARRKGKESRTGEIILLPRSASRKISKHPSEES